MGGCKRSIALLALLLAAALVGCGEDAGESSGPERGEACDPRAATGCAEGLVCTPSGTCQELCAEVYCEGNDRFCFGSSVNERSCSSAEAPHCVEGEGRLRICRDLDLDTTEVFCEGNDFGYAHYYHTDYEVPQECFPGTVIFAGSRICLSGISESRLTQIGGSLEVSTDDPSNLTDDASCDYLSYVELSGLTTIGGDLELGEVSGVTERSPMKVSFDELKLPVLESVYGRFWWQSAEQVANINYPELQLVGGFFALSDLPAMETIYLPSLEVIEGGLRLHGLPALTTLRLDSLRRIDGYVSISGVPCVPRDVLERLGELATGPVSIDTSSGTLEGCEAP